MNCIIKQKYKFIYCNTCVYKFNKKKSAFPVHIKLCVLSKEWETEMLILKIHICLLYTWYKTES